MSRWIGRGTLADGKETAVGTTSAEDTDLFGMHTDNGSMGL